LEQTPQKTPPQLRQWCRRRKAVKGVWQAMQRGALPSGIQAGGESVAEPEVAEEGIWVSLLLCRRRRLPLLALTGEFCSELELVEEALEGVLLPTELFRCRCS